MAPCAKLRSEIGVAVPNPTWVVPNPAPNDCVTRSLKLISLALKPVEFMLAKLLPTTSMAVEVAVSAERAVDKDVNISFSPLFAGGSVGGGQRGRDFIQVLAYRRDVLALIHRLLHGLELSQLRHELCAVGRVGRILILQLRHQQLQEHVFGDRRGGRTARASGIAARSRARSRGHLRNAGHHT